MFIENKRIRPYKLLQKRQNLNRNAVPVVKNLTEIFNRLLQMRACLKLRETDFTMYEH